MSLKLLISWVMSLLIGALGSCACLSFVFVVHSFFRVCIACTVCAAERDCWARVDTRNLFGAIDSCALLSLVFGGFLDLGEQRVLLAVGKCRVRLLHTSTVLFILRRVNKDGPARHQRLRCVEPKLERDRGATKRLEGICKYLRYITDQCRVRTLCAVLGLAVAFLQIFMDGGVDIRQSLVVTEPSAVKVASSQQVGIVEVSLVQGLVFNSCSLSVSVVECARRASNLFGSM